MRVIVYNVKGFRAGASNVADAVRDLRPDIAFITECGTARQLRKFSSALGMSAHHGSLLPIARRARNAILVREPLAVAREVAHLFGDPARLHPRGAFVAEVMVSHRRFAAIVVHLGLSGEERLRHTTELVRLIGTLEPPVLIGGDLNERPEGQAAVGMGSVGADVWAHAGSGDGATFPAEEPAARIDYLFASGDVDVDAAFVPREAVLKRVSDHLPLVADLAL